MIHNTDNRLFLANKMIPAGMQTIPAQGSVVFSFEASRPVLLHRLQMAAEGGAVGLRVDAVRIGRNLLRLHEANPHAQDLGIHGRGPVEFSTLEKSDVFALELRRLEVLPGMRVSVEVFNGAVAGVAKPRVVALMCLGFALDTPDELREPDFAFAELLGKQGADYYERTADL